MDSARSGAQFLFRQPLNELATGMETGLALAHVERLWIATGLATPLVDQRLVLDTERFSEPLVVDVHPLGHLALETSGDFLEQLFAGHVRQPRPRGGDGFRNELRSELVKHLVRWKSRTQE